jgi:phytoene synthase
MPARHTERRHASARDLEACRDAIRTGSRTFHAASLMLPQAVRDPALALYAFCRVADDAIDHARDPRQALELLQARLAGIYHGTPAPEYADRSLADVVAHFRIPRALPEALLEGFAWDAEGRRYEDLAAVQAYGARVAGTVGVMMALLMEVRNAASLARACDLGIAMQLSNIARDVGEDARAGRLYLPLSWMVEAGLDPDAFLARPQFSPELATVIARLLREADLLYQSAAAGIPALPVACRPAIHAAGLLYGEIGHEVARNGFDSVSRRAVVPPNRKARLLIQALAGAALGRRPQIASDPAAAQFLVDAVTAADQHAAQSPAAGHAAAHAGGHAATAPAARASGAPAAPDATVPARRRGPTASAIWVLELFERLERRDRALRQRGPGYWPSSADSTSGAT